MTRRFKTTWTAPAALFFIVSAVFLSPEAAKADDPTLPVRQVMAVAGLTDPKIEPPLEDGYFNDVYLETIYSKSFANVYRMARYGDELGDNQGYLLGFDVVVGGQDSCPLKDGRFEVLPQKGQVIPIAVYFDAVSCWGWTPDLKTPNTIFHVIREDDRFVIDDFWSDEYNGGDAATSIKRQFADLAKGQIDFFRTNEW